MDISRRNFIAGTSVAAAAAGLAASATAALADEEAVASAVHAWEQPLVPITDFVDELSCDIVVVGAGISGTSAAQAAAANGAKVILVEKSDCCTAHGQDNCALGSRLQQEAGYEYDLSEAARLVYNWSQSQANWYLIKTFCENSGPVMDRMIDLAEAHGLTVTLNDQMTARSDWEDLDERYRQLKYTAHNFNGDADVTWPELNLVQMLCDDAVENGTTVLFETKAEQLVKEDDRVTGVVVSDADGYKKINAALGVILATGGICRNEDMVSEWCPLALKADNVQSEPVDGATGDGIVMGMQIGAARSRCYPAPLIHPVNLNPMGPGFDTSWLYVNADGMRFCCEIAYEPLVTNARMNAKNDITWAVWDSRYVERVQKQEPHKSLAWLDTLEKDVEAAVESGDFIRADTLEELAEAIGVPADNLVATVARYNGMCATGDDKDFGVPERFLSAVEDGPFYATTINAWTLAIPYGLHVNNESQVCTNDDEAIEGLYAVGNVQGDFFANSYPVAVPGISHGRALVFGQLVGAALATGEPIDAYQYGK
jgi:succinate dehydrogenase/fumarate reductase flavoprotein subunit